VVFSRFTQSTIAILVATLATFLAAVAQAQVDLSDQAKWTLHVSHDAVKASLAPPAAGRGFDLVYNFTGGSGFAIARYEFPTPIDLPENYELSFTLAGTGPSNDLEVKLLDAAHDGSKLGDSVWWVKRRNYEWPAGSLRINNKAKHFQFAWGPLNGARIRKLGAIELVVASSSGGEGKVTVTDLFFKPLPPAKPYTGTPVAIAEGAAPDHAARLAIDGDLGTAWVADRVASVYFTVDMKEPREFDGLRIDWAGPVNTFAVEVSDDGEHWTTPWAAQTGNEQDRGRGDRRAPVRRSYVDIPDTTARYARVWIAQQADGPAGIAEIKVLSRPPSSENLGIWPLIAADYPRQAMPRYFTGRQSTWTVLGDAESTEEGLINEEGDLELWRSGPSLSPAVVLNGKGLLDWKADAPTMLDGLPIARVVRHGEGLSLTTTAFASGDSLLVRYELVNNGDAPADGWFDLRLRPFQVNPPWQFLNTPGGVARVASIAFRGDEFRVNSTHSLTLSPDTQSTTRINTFAEGEAGLALLDQAEPAQKFTPRESVHDTFAAASGARRYPLHLNPRESQTWYARSSTKASQAAGPPTAADFDSALTDARAEWESRLDRVKISLPKGNEQLAASIRASLAYILINRDGAGFQPGSRSYERSWMRDGSLTSAALLEFGLTDEVKKFIDWYAGYQFPDGAIPCVVDTRGADPVVENDSHGEFIYALAEYHRYTHDDAFALKHFGAVEKTVAHIQAERAKSRVTLYGNETVREPGKPPVPLTAFVGLMPASISHEGYSSKPMHSYWDDFFTLKGLRDAAAIARELKRDDQAKAWDAAAVDMSAMIGNSVDQARKAHSISYIPGCPELGDFDATSTTIAVNPCGAQSDLPRAWYDATFDKWWDFFIARRDGKIDYVDYTPYEWRIVGTLVMLGHRDRAWEATKWYMQDQNPPRKPGDTSASGWLHWAEIVHRDRGAGKWIGDMPHTWVASDFLRSVRTMFVYEEASPSPTLSNLVLFAGVPKEWAEAPAGISFTGLRTPYGTLNASLKKVDGWYELRYDGLESVPYRVRLAPPVAWPPKEIEVLEGGGAKNDQTGGMDGITTGMRIRFR
jgi:hypothetical protein